VRPRPTWIALTVIDEDGRGFPRLAFTLTTPGGEDRSIRLDDASRWRADDVRERGTCFLRVGAAIPEPAPDAPVLATAGDDDPWLEAESGGNVALVTERAHTVVVVRARTEIVILDEDGRADIDEWCEVMCGQRRHVRRTDAHGMVTIGHPRAVRTIDVRFPLLSADAVALERSGPLATEGAHS